MSPAEVQELPVGVYRLIWESGGHSLAAVGVNSVGKHWYAPANWVTVPSFDWSIVHRAELIERNFADCQG
jgi:hypothetical protein